MDLIENYFNAETEIKKMFGFVEGWKVLALEDSRHYYWTLKGLEVHFSEEHRPVSLDIDGYICDLYISRGNEKAVFKIEDYTMIAVDDGCGNQMLQIYDNKKEVHNG